MKQPQPLSPGPGICSASILRIIGRYNRKSIASCRVARPLMTSRRALRDVEIDGYRVPKGWVVLLAPYALHRREEYFPEPGKFDPERFTPEREKQLPRYAYVPFGAGPRICIGLHFAMMEGHLVLATIAQRISFSLLPGQAIEPDPVHHLALRPAGAVNVTVKKR